MSFFFGVICANYPGVMCVNLNLSRHQICKVPDYPKIPPSPTLPKICKNTDFATFLILLTHSKKLFDNLEGIFMLTFSNCSNFRGRHIYAKTCVFAQYDLVVKIYKKYAIMQNLLLELSAKTLKVKAAKNLMIKSAKILKDQNRIKSVCKICKKILWIKSTKSLMVKFKKNLELKPAKILMVKSVHRGRRGKKSQLGRVCKFGVCW